MQNETKNMEIDTFEIEKTNANGMCENVTPLHKKSDDTKNQSTQEIIEKNTDTLENMSSMKQAIQDIEINEKIKNIKKNEEEMESIMMDLNFFENRSSFVMDDETRDAIHKITKTCMDVLVNSKNDDEQTCDTENVSHKSKILNIFNNCFENMRVKKEIIPSNPTSAEKNATLDVAGETMSNIVDKMFDNRAKVAVINVQFGGDDMDEGLEHHYEDGKFDPIKYAKRKIHKKYGSLATKNKKSQKGDSKDIYVSKKLINEICEMDGKEKMKLLKKIRTKQKKRNTFKHK